MRKPVLILGGTAEGRELANMLARDGKWRVIYSLAGRTATPKLPDTEVRIGGFGGAVPLATYIQQEGIAALINASHPFAFGISRNAAAAANRAAVPLLRLTRPAWTAVDGDQWHEVADWPDALALLPDDARVFLAIGFQELRAFSGLLDQFFLVRTVDPPATPLPLLHFEVELGRGPFSVEDEIALLRRWNITHLICKNSGGVGAYSKLEAARALSLPVIIKRRPRKLPVPGVSTVSETAAWLAAVVP